MSTTTLNQNKFPRVSTTHLKRLLVGVGCAAGAIATTNCHTVEGVGEDMQHTGYHIEEAAEETVD